MKVEVSCLGVLETKLSDMHYLRSDEIRKMLKILLHMGDLDGDPNLP